jgi:hypothetical protein
MNSSRRLSPLLLLLTALPMQQPAPTAVVDPFAAALADYRAGRFAEAFAGFQALLAAAGDQPPPELLANVALAALRLQRSGDAEAPARLLRQHARAGERALGAFLLGHAAMLRCERAEAAARLQDAEPMAFDAALSAARAAVEHWLAADAEQGGWPAALRNAERNKPPPKREPDRPEAKPQPQPDQPPQEQDPELTTARLSPVEVGKLLERLEQKQREKRIARLQQQQSAAATAGERDW